MCVAICAKLHVIKVMSLPGVQRIPCCHLANYQVEAPKEGRTVGD